MQYPEFSQFERLIIHGENELGISVLLILAWIATSDGSINESEARQLAEISVASKQGHSVKPLLNVVQNHDIDAIQLAAEIIAHHFRGEKANLFLEMAIGIAISDGYLLPTENHILRFLADLLGVKKASLNGIFSQITGHNIPNPIDPSSAAYWRNSEKTRSESGSRSDSSHDEPKSPPRNNKATAAYAVLGLEHGASKEEIRKAYLRLAQVHHPDRFSSLGEESVAAATATFQKINDAYEYLVKYA